MIASDLRLGHTTTLELRATSETGFGMGLQVGSEVRLRWMPDTESVILQCSGRIWPVDGASPNADLEMKRLLAQESARFCWLADIQSMSAAASRVVVQVHTFPQSYSLGGVETIAITDNIVEAISKRYFRGKTNVSTGDVIEWLTERTILTSGESSYLIVSAGSKPSPNQLARFSVHGSSIVLDVQTDANGRRFVTRVAQRPSQLDRFPLILLRASVNYIDMTAETQFASSSSASDLDVIIQRSQSYLTLWHEYNDLERRGVIRRAREIGWLRLPTPPRILDNGNWRCKVASDSLSQHTLQLLSHLDLELETLEIAEELPEELLPDGSSVGVLSKPVRKRTSHLCRLVAANLTHGTVDIRLVDPESVVRPPQKGYIYSSLIGDRVRLQRREYAWSQIRAQKTPMPWLALLLEGEHPPSRPPRRLKVDVKAIREFFDGPPTRTQLRALEVALNTPDFALIQGPPGTGKTRVIAALQKLLAINEQEREIFGQTLLTSYQHDAVDHAARATSVFGLPAVKIGKRDRSDARLDSLTIWQDHKRRDVENDLRLLPETELLRCYRGVRSLALTYCTHPTGNLETAGLLRIVAEKSLGYVSGNLTERLSKAAERLRLAPLSQPTWKHDSHQVLRRVLRTIRVTQGAFSDDGRITSYSALRMLQESGLLDHESEDILRQAIKCAQVAEPELLAELASFQARLLDHLIPMPQIEQSRVLNVDVEELLRDVLDELHKKVRQSAGGLASTIEEYLDDLTFDREAVRRALYQYTAVLAATCQQSVGTSMHRTKAGAGERFASLFGNIPMQQIQLEANLQFESVLVDEAARANPLDLFIPMALAKRRIILVGDHRQLPHVLEDDVERQLSSAGPDTREKLGKSLFQHLFERAQDMERRTGIVRSITLDAQYRMHPTLGQFVSNTFYESDGGFNSPRPAEEFEHDIDRYRGKVAVWRNIGRHQGEEAGRVSKHRSAEAIWVAREAKSILEEQPSLSVGVITFYVAQRQYILQEMLQVGLVSETESGLQVITHRDGEGMEVERLRVGTVDAFQGMEFDVVILSMVRSNAVDPSTQALGRRKYGFLTLPNRVCVAMSRQQRLLIVAGDADMLKEPRASELIPGFAAFYELCHGHEGLVLS